MSGHVYMCVRRIKITSDSVIFLFDFGKVSTAWYLFFLHK